MKNEYYIKKLWFTGPGIEDSPVEFINGLNIICLLYTSDAADE